MNNLSQLSDFIENYSKVETKSEKFEKELKILLNNTENFLGSNNIVTVVDFIDIVKSIYSLDYYVGKKYPEISPILNNLLQESCSLFSITIDPNNKKDINLSVLTSKHDISAVNDILINYLDNNNNVKVLSLSALKTPTITSILINMNLNETENNINITNEKFSNPVINNLLKEAFIFCKENNMGVFSSQITNNDIHIDVAIFSKKDIKESFITLFLPTDHGTTSAFAYIRLKEDKGLEKVEVYFSSEAYTENDKFPMYEAVKFGLIENDKKFEIKVNIFKHPVTGEELEISPNVSNMNVYVQDKLISSNKFFPELNSILLQRKIDTSDCFILKNGVIVSKRVDEFDEVQIMDEGYGIIELGLKFADIDIKTNTIYGLSQDSQYILKIDVLSETERKISKKYILDEDVEKIELADSPTEIISKMFKSTDNEPILNEKVSSITDIINTHLDETNTIKKPEDGNEFLEKN